MPCGPIACRSVAGTQLGDTEQRLASAEEQLAKARALLQEQVTRTAQLLVRGWEEGRGAARRGREGHARTLTCGQVQNRASVPRVTHAFPSMGSGSGYRGTLSVPRASLAAGQHLAAQAPPRARRIARAAGDPRRQESGAEAAGGARAVSQPPAPTHPTPHTFAASRRLAWRAAAAIAA